jgi:1-acyl-sn-glycerol-3-phosphate acyltransferase
MFSACVVAQPLAVGTLVALASLTFALWVVAMRRTAFTPGQAVLLTLDLPLSRVLWRAQIRGRLTIPSGQGAIVICNHRCSLDPAIIGLAADRMICWMVAREYVENPLLGWFFRIVGAIPAGRNGTDTAATKAAIRTARSGQLVGIFPEGRINDTSELLLPAHSGAVMIALKAQVPVVPCYIEGSPYDGTVWGCLFMPAKARLIVGQPIDLSAYFGREGDREVLRSLTRRVLREIAALAGLPEFEPRLAGRVRAKANGV